MKSLSNKKINKKIKNPFSEANIKKKTSLPVQCDWRMNDFMTLFTKKSSKRVISCCLSKKEKSSMFTKTLVYFFS